METIRITTDTSKHAGCGGLLGMSEDAPLYIVEHEGLETRLPGGPLAWPADRPPPPAGTYLWSVRALALDRVLAESRPVAFEIR